MAELVDRAEPASQEAGRTAGLKFSLSPRATLAFVQLPSDIVFETEAPGIFSQLPDIVWRATKMRFADEPVAAGALPSGDNADVCRKSNSETISKNNYERNRSAIQTAAGSFQPLPGCSSASCVKEYGALDVLALSCTSMSVSLGEESIRALLQAGYPSPWTHYTTMACAVIQGLKAVLSSVTELQEKEGPLRLAFISPYSDTLHGEMTAFFSSRCSPWLDVVAQTNFGLDRDTLVSSLEPQSVLQCAKNCIQRSRVHCALLCCSALRVTSRGFIDNAEEVLGMPVLTSNQCLIWESLHTAAHSCSTRIEKSEIKGVLGYGRLFALDHPDDGSRKRKGQHENREPKSLLSNAGKKLVLS